MQKNRTAIALMIAALSASALPSVSQASPERSRFYYVVGGGSPISGAGRRTVTIPIIGGEIGLKSNLSCGAGFDPTVTVSNQLNGVTDGFHNMMGDMLQNATAAVIALPGAILQRTNPEIYDMLQNGVLQGKVDFKNSLSNCEDMQKIILDSGSPGEAYEAVSESFDWQEQIRTNQGDVIRAQKKVSEASGNSGSPWYTGEKRGGLGQAPIDSISSAVSVGYNLLLGRVVTETSEVSSEDGSGKPIWEYWKSPGEAARWVTEVVGEVYWRTCVGCDRAESIPGKGLTYFYDDAMKEIEHNLQKVIDGEIPINIENLNRISAPPTLMVRQEIIEAIRLEAEYDQPLLVSRIAGEIALTRTFEQGALAKRMLTTGKMQPDIANSGPAQISIQNAHNQLTDELNILVEEMELRKRVTGNTLQIVADRYIDRRNQAAEQASPTQPSNIHEYFGRQ